MVSRTLLVFLFCFSVVVAHPAKADGFWNGSPAKQKAHEKKPQKQTSSSKDVAEELQKALDNKNPAYAGSDIKATVDDDAITLTGTVTSYGQNEMAVQIARAYAESRKIVNKLLIQP